MEPLNSVQTNCHCLPTDEMLKDRPVMEMETFESLQNNRELHVIYI